MTDIMDVPAPLRAAVLIKAKRDRDIRTAQAAGNAALAAAIRSAVGNGCSKISIAHALGISRPHLYRILAEN